MMDKKHILNADFNGSGGKVNVQVILFSFKEHDNYIVYSPHLEISGYGKTEESAMESFNISLKQFLDYTTNKKTLHKELMSLGWKLKKGTVKHPKKINAPTWRELMKNNQELENLLNSQQIVTSQKEIAIPV